MDFIYDLLYIIPTGLGAMLFLKNPIGAPEETALFIAVALIFLFYTAGFCHFPKIIKICSAGAITLFAALIIKIQEPDTRQSFVSENAWVLWAALIAAVAFLIARLIQKSRWAARGMMLILILVTVWLLFNAKFAGKELAVCIYWLLLELTISEIQLTWDKSGDTDGRKHLVSLAPFIIAAVIAVMLIPAPNKPYDWAVVKKTVSTVREKIIATTEHIKSAGDDYTTLGFSEDVKIGGALNQNDREVMTITPIKNAGGVLYLTGMYYEDFDGLQWSNKSHTLTSDRTMDALETYAKVRAFDSANAKNYIKSSEIEITYKRFNTGIVFHPAKALPWESLSEKLNVDEYNDSLRFADRMGYGTKYRMKYYRLNRNEEALTELISYDKKYDEERWREGKGGARSEYTDGYEYADYLAYKESIYENYTEAPGASDEVRRLLTEITDGADSDYEMLLRAEDYLKSLTYNISTDKLPESVDSPDEFIDYFLTEKREGYCVHFATAFTLIARSLGYPARYVQGFCVPLSQKEPVTVTSDMAHSWSEVYFENTGWIIFDATPGEYMADTWAIADDSENAAGTGGKYAAKSNAPDAATDNGNQTGNAEVTDRSDDVVPVIVMTVAAALILLIIMLAGNAMLTRRWYKSRSDGEKIRVTAKRSMALLKGFHYGIAPSETLEEYVDRMTTEMPEGSYEFIVQYERLLYSGDAMTAEDRVLAEESAGQLEIVLKKKNALKYRVYKIVVGQIRIPSDSRT